MIIPGFLISLVTFPGVIVHELAHQIFCRLMKVPVFKVKYFQLKNPCGYVVHEPTDKPMKTFLISIGPFLINTIIGAIIVLPASVGFFGLSEKLTIVNLVLLWLGISILMHAFPSTGDAKVLVNNILKNNNVSILVKILVAPVIGLIYIGAIGSVVWLDLIYAVAIAVLMPYLLVSII